jgi:hypothetical protein
MSEKHTLEKDWKKDTQYHWQFWLVFGSVSHYSTASFFLPRKNNIHTTK